MAKRGSGIGLILLVVVMATVLWLSAQAWKKFGATAIDATNPGSVRDGGQTEAGRAVRQKELPDLNDARRTTDQHASQVQDALEAVD